MRLLAIGAVLATIAARAVAAEPAPPKCLLFAADRVSWADVAAGRMPTLQRLLARGAVGWCSPATARPMTRAAAYATLGAGNRTRDPGGFVAVGEGGGAVLTNAADFQRAGRRLPYAVEVGSLGQALHQAGLKTALCVPAGSWTALLTVMDTQGRADHFVASLGRPLEAAWRQADLLALQSAADNPGQVDQDLAAVVPLLRPQDLLLFVVPTPRAPDMVALAPILIVGPGFPPGTALTSRTTLRPGLVASIDVAPTILRFFGLPLPASYVSNAPITTAARRLSVGELAGFEVLTRRVHEARRLFIPLFTTWHLVVVVLALLLARRPLIGTDRARRLRWLPLSVPAALVVGYALPLVQRPTWSVVAIMACGLATTAALTLVVALLRLSLRVAAGTLALLAVLIIAGDVLTGAELQMRAVPGYAVALGGRFYGLGNEGTAILVAAAAVLAGLAVGARARPVRVVGAVLLLGAVTVVVGAPRWGADAGGALLSAATLAAYLVTLLARRVRWWHAAAVLLAMLLAISIVVAVDVHRPAGEMTHIGRAWLRVAHEGPGAAEEIIGRKLFTAWNVSVSTPWALAPMVWVLAFSWVLLRPRGRAVTWLEAVPGLRPTAAAVVVGGLVGWAANDSAVEVPAMMFTFVVPLVAAAALSVVGGDTADAAGD